jgi:HEAT repeat protein
MPKLTVEELILALPNLIGFPDDPGFHDAVESLREIPEQVLLESFTAILDDPDAKVALGIVRAIGILELKGSQEILLRLADEPGKWFSHTDRAAIRNAAVESLGFAGDESVVTPLIELIGFASDPEFEMEIVRALGRIGSESSVRPLVDLMLEKPEIALSAAGALVEIGGEEAFQGLMETLRSKNDMVRSASIWALGKMRDERGVIGLMTFSEINDPMTRRDIAWALGQIGGFHARLALGAIAQADDDLSVRREACRAIQSGAVLGMLRDKV